MYFCVYLFLIRYLAEQKISSHSPLMTNATKFPLANASLVILPNGSCVQKECLYLV